MAMEYWTQQSALENQEAPSNQLFLAYMTEVCRKLCLSIYIDLEKVVDVVKAAKNDALSHRLTAFAFMISERQQDLYKAADLISLANEQAHMSNLASRSEQAPESGQDS